MHGRHAWTCQALLQAGPQGTVQGRHAAALQLLTPQGLSGCERARLLRSLQRCSAHTRRTASGRARKQGGQAYWWWSGRQAGRVCTGTRLVTGKAEACLGPACCLQSTPLQASTRLAPGPPAHALRSAQSIPLPARPPPPDRPSSCSLAGTRQVPASLHMALGCCPLQAPLTPEHSTEQH